MSAQLACLRSSARFTSAQARGLERNNPPARELPPEKRITMWGCFARMWEHAGERWLDASKLAARLGQTRDAKRYARCYAACERRAKAYERAIEGIA
jgi:hypothetical protein